MLKGALYRKLRPEHQRRVERFFGLIGVPSSAPVYYRAKAVPETESLVLPPRPVAKKSLSYSYKHVSKKRPAS